MNCFFSQHPTQCASVKEIQRLRDMVTRNLEARKAVTGIKFKPSVIS